MPLPDENEKKRRRTFVRLIGEIHKALQTAFTEEHELRGLTKSEIARLIGRDKSFVTRKMNGASNMTIETLADLAYALDRPIKIVMPSRTGFGNYHGVVTGSWTDMGPPQMFHPSGFDRTLSIGSDRDAADFEPSMQSLVIAR